MVQKYREVFLRGNGSQTGTCYRAVEYEDRALPYEGRALVNLLLIIIIVPFLLIKGSICSKGPCL